MRDEGGSWYCRNSLVRPLTARRNIPFCHASESLPACTCLVVTRIVDYAANSGAIAIVCLLEIECALELHLTVYCVKSENIESPGLLLLCIVLPVENV